MKKTNRLEKKLKKLNMSGDRSGAILLIRKYLEKNPPADTLMLHLAFFLYHDATQRLYQNKKSKKETGNIKDYFNESIKILEKIIKKDPQIKNSITFNSRIYLAQIYAILNNSKKAIKLGKENYKIKKNPVTSNRLADIYDRLNQNNKALWWYKNTEKISDKKNKDELILAKQGLSNFYKKIGENGKAEVYKNQTLKLILGDSLESKSMRKILKNK